jgi:hypothetical protein
MNALAFDASQHDTADVAADILAPAFADFRAALGEDGWRYTATRRGFRARRGMVTVSLKYRPEEGAAAWRARFNDGFPRFTVLEHRAASVDEALAPVVAKARAATSFFDGRLGLLSNPSKSWLGYRMWEAVRPEHG